MTGLMTRKDRISKELQKNLQTIAVLIRTYLWKESVCLTKKKRLRELNESFYFVRNALFALSIVPFKSILWGHT